MPPIAERHAEQGVAGGQQRHIGSRIGLRAGMRLHIGIARLKQFACATDRQRFSNIHMLATPVVAVPGVTLRILIGQHRALRLEH